MLIKRQKIPVRSILLTGFLPGFLKKILYRLKGYKIGKNVSIGLGSVVIGEDVFIGDNAKIGFLTVIRGKEIRINRFVQIGSLTMVDTERFIIDEDSRINEKVIVGGIRTPESLLKIGKRAIIMEYSFINPTKPIIIGDDTGVGGHCLLFTHSSWLSELEGFPVTFAPITLGNNVWLPWRVFIMPGVTIGDYVVIGANSLVNTSLPSNVLAAGSPAKIIKTNYPPTLTANDRKNILTNIFDEFINFISYNGFTSHLSEFKGGKVLHLTKGRKDYQLLYLSETNPAGIDLKKRYDLLITDEESLTNKGISFKMKLDLVQKTRTGKSEAGEEFCRFVSRFGIRFNRLD